MPGPLLKEPVQTVHMVDYALAYAEIGWSVIPLKRDKRPYESWLQYQTTRAGKKQIKAWWEKWPNANIGIVTGKISGNLVVIDIDSPEGLVALEGELGEIPATISQRTGAEGGQHLLFYSENGDSFTNMARVITGIDVRANGGYIVAAPSIHPNGKTYQWGGIDPIEDGLDDLLPLSDELKALLSSKAETEPGQPKSKNKDGWVQEALLGVSKGSRNAMGAKLIGYYVNLDMDYAAIESIMTMWNERNQPPMSFNELRGIIASIQAKEGREKMGQSLGTTIEWIETLRYPDGKVYYNVKIKDFDKSAQMDAKTLGMFSRFKWRFMEIQNRVPGNVKPKEWEAQVNAALAESKIIDIAEEETQIGVISGAINNILRNDSASYETFDYIGSRVTVVTKPNGAKRLVFKIEAIANLVRFEGEKLSRKSIGTILRYLGFENRVLSFHGVRARCWFMSLKEWSTIYENENGNIEDDEKQ
jgi:hypothetical protein